MIELLNMDCMDYLRDCEDNAFDLAIVDPPYGIGAGKKGFSTLGGNGGGNLAVRKDYGAKDWDCERPPVQYFKELSRTSKNQVIWGGNYFIDHLAATSCFLVWDKVNGDWSNADCELAWTSFSGSVRKFEFMWNGMLQGNMKRKQYRIHPTQKPVQLYEWILNKYSEPGQRILDTHLGSGSSAIAAHYGQFDFVGIEIDDDYYKAACERLEKETAQLDLLA